jgi:hypothetical protein
MAFEGVLGKIGKYSVLGSTQQWCYLSKVNCTTYIAAATLMGGEHNPFTIPKFPVIFPALLLFCILFMF